MESVISLPTVPFTNKNQMSEILLKMDKSDASSGPLEENSQYFKRSIYNLSFRGPKLPTSGSGSVRRSVRNFEMKLNGKNHGVQNPPSLRRSVRSADRSGLLNDSDETLEDAKKRFIRELPVKKKNNSTCSINGVNQKEEVTKMDVSVSDDIEKTYSEPIYSEIRNAPPVKDTGNALFKEALSNASMQTTSGTQTDACESLKKKMSLIPVKSAESGLNAGAFEVINPMHVVSLNPRGRKPKNGSTPPRVLKRRMSVSGDEQTEKFSRLTRFGSGLRKKLSASTRDIFGSVSTSPKDDTSSLSSKQGSFKRSLSSSMRDLFGGSFTMKMDKEGHDRSGKSEERRKEKSLRQSSFVIGGGITLGRSAGRKAAAGLRDSFRNMLPKLRMTRVFEVTVMLPDGNEAKVSNKYVILQPVSISLLLTNVYIE